MDDVMQIAAIVATLVTAGPAPGDAIAQPPLPQPARTQQALTQQALTFPALTLPQPALTLPALRPPGEDKFRHAAAGWAITVFAYSAARAAGRDGDDALVIALPITAVFGVGKEIADQRRGSGFSVGDLIADAIGAGAAWLVLREVQ